MDDVEEADVCRVCRAEGNTERPLFHPCVCTGSIKFIHQDCLVQWLSHSRKEYCELCKHRFSFQPIYSPDMPAWLPPAELVSGLLRTARSVIKQILDYSIVLAVWLLCVPVLTARAYHFLFPSEEMSWSYFMSDVIWTQDLVSDCFYGWIVVIGTPLALIALVFLRDQVVQHVPHDWLNVPDEQGQRGPAGLVRWIWLQVFRRQQRQRQRQRQPQHNAHQQAAQTQHELSADQHRDQLNQPLPVADGALDEGEPNADQPVIPLPPGEDVGAEAGTDNLAGEAAAQLRNMGNIVDEGPADQALPAAGGAANAVEGVGGDMAWNPIEWDRDGDELTWERLLGLDGSIDFLYHAILLHLASCSALLALAKAPHVLGGVVSNLLGVSELVQKSHFATLLIIGLGYMGACVELLLLHHIGKFFRIRWITWHCGVCYLITKVSLLMVMEIGIFPLICGWWLHICSMSLCGDTLKGMKTYFSVSPGTAVFLHWLAGMIFLFYYASFIMMTRRVVRPGVLWFLRNLNDPDFHPVQEMITIPLYRHVRRFAVSVVILGTSILLLFWVPLQLIGALAPGFLPYKLSIFNEAPVSELSQEILLLQVVLPAVLEQKHTRRLLHHLLRVWVHVIAWALGLQSYLLGKAYSNKAPAQTAAAAQGEAGDNSDDDNEGLPAAQVPAAVPAAPAAAAPAAAPAAPAGENAQPLQGAGRFFDGGPLGVAHVDQLLDQEDVFVEWEPYDRPSFFHIRIALLLMTLCVSVVSISCLLITVPVWLGRRVLAVAFETNAPFHELYTLSSGLYLLWLFTRLTWLLILWLPLGWEAVKDTLYNWLSVAAKVVSLGVVLLAVVPLLLGTLFDLILVIPLRVSLQQTPLHYPLQAWALGILHSKIIWTLTLMGPDTWLKRLIEQLLHGTLDTLNIWQVMGKLGRLVFGLWTVLAGPYVLVFGGLPLLGVSLQTQIIAWRSTYPLAMLACLAACVTLYLGQRMKKIYYNIKNDRYLIGLQLVNYEHNPAEM